MKLTQSDVNTISYLSEQYGMFLTVSDIMTILRVSRPVVDNLILTGELPCAIPEVFLNFSADFTFASDSCGTLFGTLWKLEHWGKRGCLPYCRNCHLIFPPRIIIEAES